MKQGTEIPVVPRARTRLCFGAGLDEGKPSCIFSSDAEVTVTKPNPPMAAACAMGTRTRGTRCRVRSPPWAHRCHPVLPSARAPWQLRCPLQPWQRSRVPARGGLFPAPEAGHQLGVGGRLGLQLLLSGQVEQDFQYVGGDIK